MKRASLVIAIVFILLAILHQDSWNWDKANLIMGFMPIGLFYHAMYSVVAALFWAAVVKFAWPADLEEWADGGGE